MPYDPKFPPTNPSLDPVEFDPEKDTSAEPVPEDTPCRQCWKPLKSMADRARGLHWACWDMLTDAREPRACPTPGCRSVFSAKVLGPPDQVCDHCRQAAQTEADDRRLAQARAARQYGGDAA